MLRKMLDLGASVDLVRGRRRRRHLRFRRFSRFSFKLLPSHLYHHYQHTCCFILWAILILLPIDSTYCYEPFVRYNNNNNGYGSYTNNYQQHNQYDRPNYNMPASNYNNHYHNSYSTYPMYQKNYLPGPQFCPETGRTVCSKVTPFYPSDEVFSILRMARAKRFNISSEFVDESENDSEPHFPDDEPFPKPEPFDHFDKNDDVQQQQQLSDHHQPQQTYTAKSQTLNYHNFDYSRFQQTSPAVPPYSKSYFTSYATQYPTHRYKRQTNVDSIPIEPICPSKVILLEPKAALNDKRQWKFVVNLSDRDPRLKQAIKVEVCT